MNTLNIFYINLLYLCTIASKNANALILLQFTFVLPATNILICFQVVSFLTGNHKESVK